MQTNCALPGCSNPVQDFQADARRGYCDQHLMIGVMEAIDELGQLARPEPDLSPGIPSNRN